MIHVLLVGTWPSRSCIKDSAMSKMGSSSASAAIQRSSRHPGRLCVRWSQRWFEDHGEGFPKWSSSPLKHSTAGRVADGARWALCWTECTTRFLRCPLWQPDVDRCIGGRALSLQGWRPGCVAPFGCGTVVRARPRDDGHAFPDCRECRARVKSSTASRSFEAGWMVSQCTSGAILPGSAWEAHKIVLGTFYCPKQIL